MRVEKVRARCRRARMRARVDADSWSYALDATCAHVRALTATLACLRLGRKQRARVRADARGVTVSARDDSKTCACSANLRAEVFQAYACDETAARIASTGAVSGSGCAFDVDLCAVIDALGAFQGRDGEADVRARWPNRSGALTLELESARTGGGREFRQCVYAEIAPEMMPEGEGRGEEMSFRDEANAFMLPPATLKEIVDDLEWPSGDVEIEIDHGVLRFSASGAEIGELTVDVDTSEGRLTEFTCREPSAWRYKYRFLKSATAVGANFLAGSSSGGAGGGGGEEAVTMTRVSVSNTGFLKIVHLLHLNRNRIAFNGGGLNESMVPVTFIISPVEDVEEDDAEDDE